MRTKVKRHTRKTKSGVTSVRRHTRAFSKRKILSAFKDRYNISTNIEIKKGSYKDPEGTSLARTESIINDKTGKSKEHIVLLKESKMKNEGENIRTQIHHELSHILAREKNVLKMPEFKALMNLVKKTVTYKNLLKEKDSYGKDQEELFARIYSQIHTGDSTSNEYLFGNKEMKKLRPTMKRLLDKISSNG